MMHDANCRSVAGHLDEAAGSPLPPSLADHAAACGRCAGVVARQARLERMLRALPAAPAAHFEAPPVPDAAGGRGRLTALPAPVWAAAAAAVIVAVIAGNTIPASAARVRVDRVVDVADAPPQQDERLLAMTAGIEAVAMRRPTELR